MFKSRPLIMLISGLVLALVLWGIAQVVQSKMAENKPPQIITGQENSLAKEKPAKSLSNQHANVPASILSAIQNGSELSLKGAGMSGAGISLLIDDKELARTKVDDEGNWALGFMYDIESKPISIDILTMTPDGHQIRSDQSLLVISYQYVVKLQSSDKGKALLLLTAPGAHSRVLQTPYARLPKKEGFALEAIDYDNSGGVIFSGSSEQAGRVLIYAGKVLVGESRVDNQGRWSLIFGSIMPLGAYNISAELVIAEDNSVSLTLPFERTQFLPEVEGSSKIVVKHLDDRIQISRALFGGGYQYSVVYAPTALEE
jgi:hypothetical protein